MLDLELEGQLDVDVDIVAVNLAARNMGIFLVVSPSTLWNETPQAPPFPAMPPRWMLQLATLVVMVWP